MPKEKKEKKNHWDQVEGETDKFGRMILGRVHIFKKQHRFYVTAYQKDDEKFIIVSKSGPKQTGGFYHQDLRLSNPVHMGGLLRSVNLMASKLGWPNGKGTSELEDLLGQLRQKDETTEKYRNLSMQRLKLNKEQRDQIYKYREEISQVLELYLSANLPHFRKSLNEFKKLVKRKLKEGKYQEFLAKQENMWILGLEYVSVNRHSKAGTIGMPDFIPKRFDGFHDVIEFKKPSDEVFVWKGNRWRQSTPLKDGVSQVMDYLELFDQNPAGSDNVTANRDKYRPNGFLIVGNLKGHKNEIDLRHGLRKHNSFLQRITVMTYDELIDQATTILGNLEQRSKESRKKKKVEVPVIPVNPAVQSVPPPA
jgi:hypothetical protein